MKKFFERFEAMAMAVSFAEAGEWETAKRISERKGYKYIAPERKDTRKTDRRPRMRA